MLAPASDFLLAIHIMFILTGLWAWLFYHVGTEFAFVSPQEAERAFKKRPATEHFEAFAKSAFVRQTIFMARQLRPEFCAHEPLFTYVAFHDSGTRKVKSQRIQILPLQKSLWRVNLPDCAPFYIPSPEFYFALQIKGRTLPELTLLANQLCARFAYTHKLTLTQRIQALSTKEKLLHFLEQNNIPGKEKAKKALAFVCENTESPAESALSAYLCLPKGKGGCDFPIPQTNPSISVPRHLQRFINGKKKLRPDLLFAAERVIVEYDSIAHHAANTNAIRDKERAAILEDMGYRVITVTASMLKNPEARLAMFSRVGRALGKKLEFPEGWEHAHRTLASFADRVSY